MQILHRLVKKGLLNPNEIPRLAEARGANNNRPLLELAVERGLVKEEDVLTTLAEEFGMDYVDLAHAKVDPDVIKAVPLKLVHRRTLMPLSRENGTLVVATGDPFDINSLDELQMLTGLQVQPVL